MIPIAKLALALAPDILLLLADDENTGTANPNILQEALNGAEAEVRVRLAAGGWNLDPAEDDFLAELVVALAIGRLFQRRRELEPGPWVERIARALRVLAEIAAGTFPLGTRRSRPRVFGNTAPPRHRPDSMEEC